MVLSQWEPQLSPSPVPAPSRLSPTPPPYLPDSGPTSVTLAPAADELRRLPGAIPRRSCLNKERSHFQVSPAARTKQPTFIIDVDDVDGLQFERLGNHDEVLPGEQQFRRLRGARRACRISVRGKLCQRVSHGGRYGAPFVRTESTPGREERRGQRGGAGSVQREQTDTLMERGVASSKGHRQIEGAHKRHWQAVQRHKTKCSGHKEICSGFNSCRFLF